MKFKNVLLVLITVVFTLSSYAQRNTELEKKIIERKVDTIFTVEETAINYIQFYANMKDMNMSDELEDDYTNIILKSASNIRRLDDKDKNYTKAERKVLFDKLTDKMYADVRAILNDEQYRLHKLNLDDILKRVYRKQNWEWDRD